MQGVQGQTDETVTQENKELEKKKVSIRRHNDFKLIVFTDVLLSDVENVEGGKPKYYYEHWKKYTSDTSILDIIENGLKSDFDKIPLHQDCCDNFPL